MKPSKQGVGFVESKTIEEASVTKAPATPLLVYRGVAGGGTDLFCNNGNRVFDEGIAIDDFAPGLICNRDFTHRHPTELMSTQIDTDKVIKAISQVFMIIRNNTEKGNRE